MGFLYLHLENSGSIREGLSELHQLTYFEQLSIFRH